MPLPFLTPIIVAAGTTFVGSFFQNRNDEINRSRQKRQAILDMAGKTYEDLSKILDTLHYTLVDEAIYIAIRKARGNEENEEDVPGWKSYEASLVEWKSNRNHLISEVDVYYGKENAKLLTDIDGYFDLGEKLVRATYYKTGGSLWKVGSKATEKEKAAAYKKAKYALRDAVKPLKRDIQRLNSQIVHLLQSENVGDLRKTS